MINCINLLLAAAAVSLARSEYVLETTFGGKGDDFFSHFNYFTSGDPTHGFVDFQGPGAGLTEQDQSGVTFLKTDTTQNSGNNGRKAIRLHSKQNWSKGLFIIDFGHIPASVCGSWPAWWFNGSGSRTWPATGEIDVLEYVHKDQYNQGHLHTAPGCYMTSKTGVDMSGHVSHTDCGAGGGYTGCGATSQEISAGDGFNNAGAGVYVVEFNFDQQWPIKMWSFLRSEIPADILNGKPSPMSWKLPFAMWHIGASCPASFFDRQTMIFDQTFCGDWAGNAWNGSGCAASTGYGSCVDYVRENGQAFKNSYFAVNNIKIYQWDATPAPPPAPTPTPCTPQDADPYASGSFVQCCGGSGFQKCLKASEGWAYRCQPCTQSCPDDKDWRGRCGLGGIFDGSDDEWSPIDGGDDRKSKKFGRKILKKIKELARLVRSEFEISSSSESDDSFNFGKSKKGSD